MKFDVLINFYIAIEVKIQYALPALSLLKNKQLTSQNLSQTFVAKITITMGVKSTGLLATGIKDCVGSTQTVASVFSEQEMKMKRLI